MTARRRLADRCASETFDVEVMGLRFTATISRFADGQLGEVFLQNHKASSHAGVMACDAAVLASLCLQHGVPLDVVSLMRDSRGCASSPIGVVLDRVDDILKEKQS
jgi:ribonucleoside-diphosphate reductase alpha chain